jgi:hypothetical protein
MKIYLIGSLRNKDIPSIAATLREALPDDEFFDDWYAAGPEADDFWKCYEQERNRTYAEALDGYAANHVYHFDKAHLDDSDAAVLILPAGRSGHLELGYMAGRGKATFILLPQDNDRWDVMYRFADCVCVSVEELTNILGGL